MGETEVQEDDGGGVEDWGCSVQCANGGLAATPFLPFVFSPSPPQARWEELLPKHQAMEADHELLKKVTRGAHGIYT